MNITIMLTVLPVLWMTTACNTNAPKNHDPFAAAKKVFERVSTHEFHPLNEDWSMTKDRRLEEDGIADLRDNDWKVRLLAVRDLIRVGVSDEESLKPGLKAASPHVRYVTAMALGILRAEGSITDLEDLLRHDTTSIVRSQAAIALGQMESTQSLDLLKKKHSEDPSKDVRHQCELAIYQIEHRSGATEKLLQAYLELDESTFNTADERDPAPDFVLEDTEGTEWKLSSFRDKQWVVLIWVFADWCPVCHGEFHDLMEMEQEISNVGVQVFTLETHDTYRGRVMVGQELEPEYWFSKTSFKDAYTSRIFWPHLLDRAGTVGAMYGIDPLAFAVHAEYINRPATVIIDPDGDLRFSYTGTFWGDRPTIEQTLDMIRTQQFSYEHPKRRKM